MNTITNFASTCHAERFIDRKYAGSFTLTSNGPEIGYDDPVRRMSADDWHELRDQLISALRLGPSSWRASSRYHDYWSICFIGFLPPHMCEKVQQILTAWIERTGWGTVRVTWNRDKVDHGLVAVHVTFQKNRTITTGDRPNAR